MEEINLEQMVMFDDGLRPAVRVYSIDSEARKMYYTDVSIGITLGICNTLEPPTEEQAKREGVFCTMTVNRFTQACYHTIPGSEDIPESENREQEMLEICRNTGWNLIRVQKIDHIDPATKKYIKLYQDQFTELLTKFALCYGEFSKEHPGYVRFNYP